ncbi:MAG TPA: DUF1667 domain-containing protein [Clostridia bacterium]|jgi:CxxC motif-containing protein|nr:DUF1667 domain-containing protein [Clostridia bacterium]
MNLTCIECPKGCFLTIEIKDSEVIVEGNDCLRGKRFGEKEVTNPTRTIATTVKTIFPELPVVSVRTATEIPKGDIFKVMEEINKVVIDKVYPIGTTLISNVCGTGADIITTSDMTRIITDKEM